MYGVRKWLALCLLVLAAGCAADMKGEQHMQFLRAHEQDGRWWLIDPHGAEFISKGVDTVRFAPERVRVTASGSYAETVKAKYATEQAWREDVARSLFEWGFNTLGGASDDRVSEVEVGGRHLAYAPIVSMGSRFVSQKTGGSAWKDGFFPDVFDPEFEQAARALAMERCAPRKNDPWLLGWFADNELRWGPDWRGQDELLTVFLGMPLTSPGRAAAIGLLRERYGDVEKFNQVWATACRSWDEVSNAGAIKPPVQLKGVWVQNQEVERRARQGNPQHAAFLADCDAFLELVAERYFRITNEAIKAADPNHLNLGCRFAYVPARPVLEAAARYVDVISFNCYHNDPRDTIEAYAAFGKPVLVGEFSFKGADSGLPNTRGAGALVKTQKDRADAFREFVSLALGHPSFIGYHWFKHSDQPKDSTGENSNYGVVNFEDKPYELLTKAMTELNAQAEMLHRMHSVTIRTFFEVEESFHAPNLDGQYGERRYSDVQALVHTSNFDNPSEPCTLRLVIENVSDRQAAGKLIMRIEPADGVSIAGADDLSYSLKPRERKVVPMTAAVKPSVHDAMLTAIPPDYWDRAIPVSLIVQGRFRMSGYVPIQSVQEVAAAVQAEQPYTVRKDDAKLAEIRWAIAGDHLAFHAIVLDRRVTPASREWEGNLDVLFSLPAKGVVHQVVFIPREEAGRSEVRLHRNGDRQPDPEISWEARPRADYGYDLAALIPLKTVQVAADKPFLAEVAVVAPIADGAAPSYVTMFASENAYCNDIRFGCFEPVPSKP